MTNQIIAYSLPLHTGSGFLCLLDVTPSPADSYLPECTTPTVIGELTADETLEDDNGTGKGDGDVMGLENLGCGEDFEEENKDGGGPVPRLSM